MSKVTPLYAKHEQSGGHIVEFGGYLLPVQFDTGIIKEHEAVRTKAGIFDVSHMGELTLTGPDSLKNVQTLLCNDMSGMSTGRCRYSPMLNENGGVVDDLLVYKLDEDKYLLIVNAANRDKDAEWVASHISGDVEFRDISDSVAQIALQGPSSYDIMCRLTDIDSIPVKYYTFKDGAEICGFKCLISRTGYTGEDGFEIYTEAGNAEKLWDALLAAGGEFGLIPCGLGARDTLRLEAAMPLYGHEMNDGISPLEAGLGTFVKLQKEYFIGKNALISRGEPKIKRVGLELIDRGIAREGMTVYHDGKEIGRITSGTHSPTLKKAIAMAYVPIELSEPGTIVELEVRGKMLKAGVVPLPFYKRNK